MIPQVHDDKAHGGAPRNPFRRTGDISSEGFGNKLERPRFSRRGLLFLLAIIILAAVVGYAIAFQIRNELPPLRGYQPPYSNQEVIVIPLLHPGDSEPVTRRHLEELAQGVRTFYEEESFGKTHYTIRVLEWQVVQHAIDQKDRNHMLSDIATAGDEIVGNQGGADKEHNQTRVYIMGVTMSVFAARGWGEKREPALYNRIWINANYPEVLSIPDVLIHELAHTLGLAHDDFLASRLIVPDDFSSPNVEVIQGSGDSVMGNGELHFNVCQKVALGWVTREQIYTVTPQLGEDSGSYTLAAHDIDPPKGIIALRIPVKTYDYTFKIWRQQFYYVQYNTPLIINGQFTRGGLEIRLWDEEVGSAPVQVWIDHETKIPIKVFPDPLVDDGEYFYDRNAGITIKQCYHSASSVTVQVRFDNK